MRLFFVLLYVFYVCSYCTYIPTQSLFPHPCLALCENNLSLKMDIQLWWNVTTFQVLVLIFSLAMFFISMWLKCCSEARYVPFSTNLNLFCKNKTYSKSYYWWIFLINLVVLFLVECESDHLYALILANLNLNFLHVMILKYKNCLPLVLALTMFSISTTPAAQLLCICITQIVTFSFSKNSPRWLFLFLILMSNDIEKNPGPRYRQNFFNFMNWNLNSLATNNFGRIQLIEAHNSIYNYDLISICETSLTDSLTPLVPEIEGYTFEPANHPDNVSHGGVGLFYKNSLPISIRRDLSFNESIVIEMKFGRKKIFLTVLYRSPSFNYKSPEFKLFLENFTNLHAKINAENPYATFYTGDFNGHSQLWWPGGDTNREGSKIEELFNSLNLTQVISEPTNFTPGCRPSCIDLIVTDQPNLVLDSGTRDSLDPKCHHQIIHCKVNFRIPPPSPSERKTWYYHRANTTAIQRSFTDFPWEQHLNLNRDVNWQVKTFTETILNIMSNFIPNEVKRFIYRDPPWIDKQLKCMLNRKNRLYKNCKKHGFRVEDKIRLDTFREECKNAIENAKVNYLTKLGNKLNDPSITNKSYWKIINRVMNKNRAPMIPPILVDNSFVLDCKEKVKLFNEFFSKQCKLIYSSSTLPIFYYHTNKRLGTITIQDGEILTLIRSINPNKASGSDGVSGHMLQLCDQSVVLPLKIIFENILNESTYPELWKLANVTPVYKKRQTSNQKLQAYISFTNLRETF